MSSCSISIFMSCYNQGDYLSQAIESVLGQTFKDFELLLYDDGSTDKTREIISKYKDPRIKVTLNDCNKGVANCVNDSLRRAKGSIWVWVPSDDILLPNCLEVKYQYSHEGTSKSVFYSYGARIDDQGKYILQGQVTPPLLSPDKFRERIWQKCEIGFTGVWIPMSVFEIVGGFPEDLSYSEDYYWLLRAVSLGVDFECIPITLYLKRLHSNRVSARYAKELPDGVIQIQGRVKKDLQCM